MRHVEIMAAGCVPYFVDLDDLPPLTMQFLPRSLLQEAKSLPGVSFQGSFLDPSSFKIDDNVFDPDAYYDVASRILEHSRKHLTTKAMAQYVLRTIGNPLPKRALMATSCVDDYLQDSMLHGLKSILRKRVVDFVPQANSTAKEFGCVLDHSKGEPVIPEYRLNMYMDSWAARSEANYRTRQGYGKGFTVWNRLDQSLLENPGSEVVLSNIRSASYDVIFLSDRLFDSSQRSFVEFVRAHTSREKVVIFSGGDQPANQNALEEYHKTAMWIFQREIY